MKTASTEVPPPPKANTPRQTNVILCWGQCGRGGRVLTRKWGKAVPGLAQAQIHQELNFQSIKGEEKSPLRTCNLLQSCLHHWGPRPPSALGEETSVSTQAVFFSKIRMEGSIWLTSHAIAELRFQRGLRSKYSLSR